ncbi:SDR family oxidoreductase [Neorhizobium sp. NPDC001467]|uniref:SDR family oxidoreductase n=1 Tax=Neorhizobium sp. NPDC001467 TaxID=3390595 RepID=UPI003D009FAD
MARLLVTGANGKLGRDVIRHLLETVGVSAQDVIAASRDTSALSDLKDRGIEIRKADFSDAATLATAFDGIDRALIISTDALAVPSLRLTQHKAAIAAAQQAGVSHILYTSMPEPETSLVSFAPDHHGSEEAIRATGIAYTILRNAWYHDNYLMSMPHNLQGGKWFTATGSGKVATISRDDCALAAAIALAKPPAGNRILTLTGASSLTADEVAATVSEAAGKPLEVVQVNGEQLAAGMAAAGLPDFLVRMLASADANIAAGKFDIVTDDYKTLTGRDPQSLQAFLQENRNVLLG